MDANSLAAVKEITGKLDELIRAATGVAQQGGEHFWPILVRQELIIGYTLTGISLILALISLVALIYCLKAKHAKSDDEGFFAFIACLFLIIAAIPGSIGIAHVLNPEYYAFANAWGMMLGR